jgi:hypothetical protein
VFYKLKFLILQPVVTKLLYYRHNYVVTTLGTEQVDSAANKIFPKRLINNPKKVKQSRHAGAWEEWRYSSYSFTTSALDMGEWSASRPARALPPGKGPPVPIVQEAGWAPEPVWTQMLQEKSFVPAGDRTPIARSSSP